MDPTTKPYAMYRTRKPSSNFNNHFCSLKKSTQRKSLGIFLPWEMLHHQTITRQLLQRERHVWHESFFFLRGGAMMAMIDKHPRRFARICGALVSYQILKYWNLKDLSCESCGSGGRLVVPWKLPRCFNSKWFSLQDGKTVDDKYCYIMTTCGLLRT